MKFLLRKNGHWSKTAFMLTMTMLPVVAMLWVVAVRLAFIQEELFVEALISSGGIFSILTFLISRLYVKRRQQTQTNKDEEVGNG